MCNLHRGLATTFFKTEMKIKIFATSQQNRSASLTPPVGGGPDHFSNQIQLCHCLYLLLKGNKFVLGLPVSMQGTLFLLVKNSQLYFDGFSEFTTMLKSETLSVPKFNLLYTLVQKNFFVLKCIKDVLQYNEASMLIH